METFFANDGAYVVLAFATLSIPAAAAIVTYFWYKLRRDEMLASLKRALSDRGMSAEEIRAVIEAAPHGSTEVAQDLAALKGAGAGVVSGGEQCRA
jgi:hypothetical protein